MITQNPIMSDSTSQQRDEMSQNPEEKSHLRDEASIARVLKYTGLFGGVQVIYALIAIVRNKITAVLLGLTGMGLIENYNRLGRAPTSALPLAQYNIWRACTVLGTHVPSNITPHSCAVGPCSLHV